jgi:hypothetical protein
MKWGDVLYRESGTRDHMIPNPPLWTPKRAIAVDVVSVQLTALFPSRRSLGVQMWYGTRQCSYKQL